MRAWRFSEFGDIKNMRLGDYPTPEPGGGEVLIKLNYAALNPADRLLVEGKYPGAGDLPLTVGRDGAGTIEAAAMKRISALFALPRNVSVVSALALCAVSGPLPRWKRTVSPWRETTWKCARVTCTRGPVLPTARWA